MSPPDSTTSAALDLRARAIRVVLGSLAVAVGAGGTLGTVALVGSLSSDPRWLSLAPLRRAGSVAVFVVPLLLFSAFAFMGSRRVAAGLRGRTAPRPPGSLAEHWTGVHGRLHASRATRTAWALLSSSLLLGAIGLAAAGPASPGVPTLLGCATLAGLVATHARVPQSACAFCGGNHAEVRWLVAGDAAAICDACAIAALTAFGRHFDGAGEREAWIRTFVEALPERCPRALSRPFLEQIAGRARTAAGIRNAVVWCFKLGNEPLARELLEAIPAAERLPSDWINLGVALSEEGRFEEALHATRAAGDGEPLRPWVLGNCALFSAQLSPGAAQPELAARLRDVEDAQRLVLLRRPDGWEQDLSSLRGTEAELRRRAGDPEGALRALELASRGELGKGWRALVHAKVLAGLGRTQEARAETERALVLLHPESLDAKEASSLLASL